MQAISINRIQRKHFTKAVTSPLDDVAERGLKLKKLTLAGLNLTKPPINNYFPSLLKKCSALTKLDLSGSVVSNVLESVLRSLVIPLQEITMKSVCMTEEDVQSFFVSKHASYLREVDLSNIYWKQCPVCCPPHNDDDEEEDLNEDNVVGNIDDSDHRGSNASDNEIKASAKKHEHSPAIIRVSSHSVDAQLYLSLFRNLDKLQKLKVLHMTSEAFGAHRLQAEYLNHLLDSLNKLSLCELVLKQIPLAEDDILDVVSVLARMPSFRHLSVTRSGVSFLGTDDSAIFWRRIRQATKGNNFSISISNMPDE